MSRTFNEAVEHRRSIYSLKKESSLSDVQLEELIAYALKHAPSPFNSQSGRVLLLTGQEHDKLWNHIKEILRGIVPADRFGDTEQKLDSFRAGYGTVLFFEDQDTVRTLQEQFPLYKDNFPVWSLQSSGMLQYIVWTSLEDNGLGASLQHYNPLIDKTVAQLWNIPAGWKLLSQMPFGIPGGEAGPKSFLPIEDRFRVAR